MSYGVIMEQTGRTNIFGDRLSHIDNIEDFKTDIYEKLDSYQTLWKQKIQQIMADNNYSQTAMAELCGVSRATVIKWCKGSVPQNRETFIKVGFAAHYDLDEMNHFLKRYGRYPELYPKSLEDSIYIFVLNSSIIEHSYSAAVAIRERLERVIVKLPADVYEARKTVAQYDTSAIMGYILNISEIDELREFWTENRDMYKSAFHNLYEYVKTFVRNNNASYFENEKIDNINYLADTLGWSSSLRKCVYMIYKDNWFPLRNKVIALGIHLNMTVDQINDMLKLAKMEPLYVINPLESVIIFAIEDAELSDCIYEGTDDLYNHVLEIFEELGISGEYYHLEELI